MAGQDRMTIAEVVRDVLRDQHADMIRESVRAVAQELMEAEVCELIGAQRVERFNRETGRRTDIVGISPTTPRSSGWSRCSRSKPTTNGSSDAPPSARNRWPLSCCLRRAEEEHQQR
jgi:transposase-like protein